MLKLFKKKKFDLEAFIAGSVESLQLVNQGHRDNWKLGSELSWQVSERDGRITFAFADGSKVSAPFQVVGIYDTNENSFTWAWDHPAVIRPLQLHATRVKLFGQESRAVELLTPKLSCTEKRAWEYTALAMLLSEANGAYRALIASNTYVFLTFGEVSVSQKTMQMAAANVALA